MVNDVKHRKTTYPGQSLCLDNMGPITIPDENGETSALRYLNVVSDRHTGCFIATTLVENKAQTAREQDTVIRRTHRHCLQSGGTQHLDMDLGTDVNTQLTTDFAREQGMTVSNFAPHVPRPRGRIG